MVTYEQYINRLREWTVNYLDYLSARIEFDQMVDFGFNYEEAFDIVLSFREEEVPPQFFGRFDGGPG